jgi:hypothetical protein
MKSAMCSACWVMGILVAVYAGSYFFFVSPIAAGLGAGGGVHYVQVVPWYWSAPTWLNAPELYGPIHVLDKNILRPARWKPPPDGDL